jgi:hypothetical protein
MAYEVKFLVYLGMTICIETAVLYAALRFVYRYGKEALSVRTILFAGIIASFATLPYVWFIVPYFARTYVVFVIAGEGFALIAECVFYCFILRVARIRAFVLSLLCNAASFSAGLLLGIFIR